MAHHHSSRLVTLFDADTRRIQQSGRSAPNALRVLATLRQRPILSLPQLWDREVLQDTGKVTTELAKAHAASEFEKFRIVQDCLFESDFDRMLKQLPKGVQP